MRLSVRFAHEQSNVSHNLFLIRCVFHGCLCNNPYVCSIEICLITIVKINIRSRKLAINFISRFNIAKILKQNIEGISYPSKDLLRLARWMQSFLMYI